MVLESWTYPNSTVMLTFGAELFASDEEEVFAVFAVSDALVSGLLELASGTFDIAFTGLRGRKRSQRSQRV